MLPVVRVGGVASRVRSRYRRRLDDVPVAGQPVVIHLTVRRVSALLPTVRGGRLRSRFLT
jgi:hypothetical protein